MTAVSRSRVAAGLLTIAAAGHAVAIPHHADAAHGGIFQGAVFAAVAVAQLVAAAGMARRRTEKRLRQLVVVGTGVLVALWAVSRTVGLPLGAHGGGAEAVGALDAVTVAAQLGVVAVLARPGRRHLRTAVAASFAGVVVAAALNISDVTTTAGATPHSHAEADAGHDESSGVDPHEGATHHGHP